MGQLALITSNPVTDAFNADQKRATDQQAAELTNAINEQSYQQNAQLFPSKLRQVNAATVLDEGKAKLFNDTYNDQVIQSHDTTRRGTTDADKSALGLQFDQDTYGNRVNEQGYQTQRAGTDAQKSALDLNIDQQTAGSQVSEAQWRAIKAGADAQVAQNGAQYDLEGRWFDLFKSNPQLALTEAPKYKVPPELVAAAQDQTKASWMTKAWATVLAQYPNDTPATRAAVYEQMIKANAANPSPAASSALQVPAGSPVPSSRQDQLRGIAAQLGLQVGSRDYAAFLASDGKTLPAQFLTAEEAKAAGFPDGVVVKRDGRVAYKPPAPAAQVSVNATPEGGFNKEYGGAQGTAAADLIGKNADAAQAQINTYDALQGALTDFQATGGNPGAFAPLQAKIGAIIQGAGINPDAFGLPADAGPAQRIAALTNQLTLQARSTANGTGMPGAMSDADRAFLQASVANLGDTPSGIKGKIIASKLISERQIEAAQKWLAYPDHTQDGWEKFRQEWLQYGRDHPVFSQAVQHAIAQGIDPTVPPDLPPGSFYAGQSKSGKRAFSTPDGGLVEEQ